MGKIDFDKSLAIPNHLGDLLGTGGLSGWLNSKIAMDRSLASWQE